MSNPHDSAALPLGPALVSPFLSRAEGAAELYLIRHADAVPSLEDIASGSSYDDQPLSHKGRLQAQALARRLKDVPFVALYASPLRRTQETAAPLAEAFSLTIQIEPDLREVMFSEPIGLEDPNADKAATLAAMRTRLEYVVRVAATTGKWTAIPGAEDSALFRQRVVNIVDTIAARHPGERVAIFSHGGVVNVYMAALLGIEKDYFYPIYNASINVARVHPTFEATSRLLLGLNDAAHLIEEGLLTER
jgi:broad specificity phosphatase PhoE